MRCILLHMTKILFKVIFESRHKKGRKQDVTV